MVLENVRIREGPGLPGDEKKANTNGLGLRSQGQPRPTPRSHAPTHMEQTPEQLRGGV